MLRVAGVFALLCCASLAAGCGGSHHVTPPAPPHLVVERTWLSKLIAREARLLQDPHPHSMQITLGKRRDVVVMFGAFSTPAATCTTTYCPSSLGRHATSVRLVVSPRTHRLLSLSLGQRIAPPQALGIARRSSPFLRFFRPAPGTTACSIPRAGFPGGSARLRGRCTTAFVSSPPYSGGAIRVRFGWVVTVRLRDGRVLGSQLSGTTPPQLWAVQ